MGSAEHRPDVTIKATDQMLSELEGMVARMNAWEKGFFESITDQFYNEGRELTSSQRVKLEEIYARYL